MEPFSWSSDVYDTDFERINYGFLVNSAIRYGSDFSSSSLLLDGARGELEEAPVKLEPKGGLIERTTEALKNHSEAEKRRRARINAHLDTLRSLVPGAKKMDKASLLGEVVSRLKEQKRKATEASESCFVPMEIDELKVEQENGLEGRPHSIRVSLSCDYKQGLLSDLRKALNDLNLIIMKAEISTLGSRMKNVIVMTRSKEEKTEANDRVPQFHASSVSQAIRSVLDKFSTSNEFLGTTLSNKRLRSSIFNSQNSSSFKAIR